MLEVPEHWRTCMLCDRRVPPELITLHHLKPKSRGGTADDRTPLCTTCHKQLHVTYSNKELEKSLDSIATLRESPRLQDFLKWIRKQRGDRRFQATLSNAHPEKRRRRRRGNHSAVSRMH